MTNRSIGRLALVGALVSVAVLVSTASGGWASVPKRNAEVRFDLSTFGTDTAAAVPTAEPCFRDSLTCGSTNPEATMTWEASNDTTGCVFRLDFSWGDGSPNQTETLTGGAAGTKYKYKHKFASKRAAERKPYAIQATGTVLASPPNTICAIGSAAATFTPLCTTEQLSGAHWSALWPGDHDVNNLANDFRPQVEAFRAALVAAGATAQSLSTVRSYQRSYLMHFSYLVGTGRLAANAVPAYVPQPGEDEMDICWLHRDNTGAEDAPTSITAAQSLMTALGVDATLRVAPALTSRHNSGHAIDMHTHWSSPALTIRDANGNNVTITSRPRSGVNAELIAVGATYGVIHFTAAASDRNHWSDDGH
jgi:hypothetical protein